ncbi:MAG: DMT family transporter [Nitrososphaeria archaeon]|nr:DMT family transporter [Nitrososphaeria archaeon]
MIEIVFAILSSFTFAYNIIGIKRGLQRMDYVSCSLLVSAISCITYIPFLFFVDFSQVNMTSVLLFALSGLIAPGLARLLFFQSLQKVGALITSSVMPAQPIISAIFAVIILSERPPPNLWIGILSIIAGAIIIETSISKNNNQKTKTAYIILPMLGVLMGGLGDPIRKIALNISNQPFLGTVIANLAALILYYLTYIFNINNRKSRKLTWADFKLMLVAGVVMALAWIFTFYALSYGSVSKVAPIINTQPLFVYLLAHFYPQEIGNVSTRPLIGAIIIIVGLVMFLFI